MNRGGPDGEVLTPHAPAQPAVERTSLGPERVGPRGRHFSRASRTRRRERRRRTACLAALFLFSAALVVATLPGRMSADSLTQIEMVRVGRYTDWHTPLLMMLWRPAWLLGVGPSTLYALSVLTFVFALYGVLRAALGAVGATVTAIAITAMPAVLGYVTYFGRDQWFASFSLATFASVLAARRSEPGWRRRGWIALALAGIWLLLASRQNAAPVAGTALWALVACCGPWPFLGRWDRIEGRRGRRFDARLVRGAVAAVMLFGFLAAQQLVRNATGVTRAHPEQQLYLYDLGALSVLEHRLLLDPEFYPAQDLALLEQRFSADTAAPLVFPIGDQPPLTPPVPVSRIDELRGDWLDAIETYPERYARFRVHVMLRQLAWDGRSDWVYHPAVDANRWGYHFVNPGLQEPIDDYLRAFAANDYLQGGWVHELWAYVLVTIGGLAYFASRDRARQTLAWFCLGSLGYQATILVATMGVAYRLGLLSVILALVVASVAVADLVRWVRSRLRSAPAPADPLNGAAAAAP